MYNKVYPTKDDFGLEDLAGVRISAKTKAELREWWLIKENYSLPLIDDSDKPF